MKLLLHSKPGQGDRGHAFTLIEVMISMAVVAMMFVSLYAGITQGLAVISTARENMRATQIMIEKIELLRLYSWDQMNAPGFIPGAFAERLMPSSATNSSTTASSVDGLVAPAGVGTIFVGTILLEAPPVSAGYSNNMRLATLTVAWTNGNIRRERSMQTLVAQQGIHDYVY
jgi:prepilin-type N-terminal cleavage/methylation domain-containing protein